MTNKTILALSIGACLTALTLAACGGGSTSTSNTAGTVTGNTAIGTITGFGSIVVDGVHYDDSAAGAQRESSPDSMTTTDTKLGQRVVLNFDDKDAAVKIEVRPELEGKVSSVDVANSRFVVNGITVLVNSDAAAGTVTVFGDGYTKLDDVKTDDFVEVHGMPKLDTSAGAAPNSYVVQATRVEKESGTPSAQTWARASGIVQDLAVSDTATTFKLGGLTVDATGAKVRPQDKQLANGQYVSVLSSEPVANATMKAKGVRIHKHGKSGSSDRVRLAGAISEFSAESMTFQLAGVTVNAKDAKLEPTGLSLANGRFVRAIGVFDDNGVLVAAEIKGRDLSKPDVELIGAIANFNSAADFTVRGVPVDASDAQLKDCPPSGLANDQVVEIHAGIGSSSAKVIASSVECKGSVEQAPAGMVIELKGMAAAADETAKTFTLSAFERSIVVSYDDATFFDGGLTPATVGGKQVSVEGTPTGPGALKAKKVRPVLR